MYYDYHFKPGDIVFYRLLPKQAKYIHTKGFLSNYPAKVVRKIGNSYEYNLKVTKIRSMKMIKYA